MPTKYKEALKAMIETSEQTTKRLAEWNNEALSSLALHKEAY